MSDTSVRIDAPMKDRYDEVLTADALGFLADLHRRFDGRRRELLSLRDQRYAELAAGGGRRTSGAAGRRGPAPGRSAPRRTGPRWGRRRRLRPRCRVPGSFALRFADGCQGR